MKTLFIILLYCLTLNATIWYVDRDATGNDAGTSWANAFPNITDTYLDWTAIGSGDTIYISGGSDSTKYSEWEIRGDFNPTEINNGSRRTFATDVIICPSWETGHNGDVYVYGNTSTVSVLECYAVCNLTIKGINFILDADAVVGGGANVELGYDSLVTIDSCIITNTALGQAVAFTGETKSNSIINSIMQSLYNTEAGNEDLFTFSGIGGLTLRNNVIARRNNYVGIAEDGTNMTANLTSLTDTDLNMIPDYHINATVTVGLSTLYVTGNTATTLTGASWSGGEPADGANWTVASTAHKDFIQWSDLRNQIDIIDNGVNMTVTSTSLTDNDYSFSSGMYVGDTVIVGSSRMIVTSNDGDHILHGTGGWSSGTPSNGTAWVLKRSKNNDPNLTVTFDKNFMYILQPFCTGWNQGFYSAGEEYTQKYKFTNNIFAIDVAYAPDVFPDEPGDVHSVVVYTDDIPISHAYWEIFNNTFITPLGGVFLDNVDSIKYVNNLTIGTLAGSTASILKLFTGDTRFDTMYKWIDYNHYSFPSWNSNTRPFSVVSGNDYNFGEWQLEGLDVNSDTGYVSVADVRDSVIASYMPTSQLQGTDLSAYGITDDILGNPRTVWTIGALEYQATTPTNVRMRRIIIQ